MRHLKLVLTNIWSDKNLGDHFIAIGIVKMIRDIEPNAEISCVSMFGSNQKEALETEYYALKKYVKDIYVNPIFSYINVSRLPQPQLFNMIKYVYSVLLSYTKLYFLRNVNSIPEINAYGLILKSDLVIFTGGNYLTAKYGLKQVFELMRLLFPAFLRKKNHRNYVFFGESVFGFDSHLSRTVLKNGINKSSYFIVRENLSKKFLSENGLYNSAKVLPDFAVYLRHLFPTHSESNRSIGKSIVVGISVRPWNFWKKGNYIKKDLLFRNELVGALCEIYFHHETKFVVVPWTIGPVSGEDDFKVSKEIVSMLRSMGVAQDKVSISKHPNDLKDVYDIYSKIDINVSVRLHCAIMASLLDIPSIIIEYQGHKASGTADLLGLSDLVLNMDRMTKVDLVSKIELVIANLKYYKEKIREQGEMAYSSLEKFRDNELSKLFENLKANSKSL
ncbi:MAG: polysaccharide pyruvyl transferase family protein [Candidatus Thermoplasmatota archaeon]|nr:polysaccharide pyruvyl transferase family protein [Candidatus Thermoplasmatota archaeon]